MLGVLFTEKMPIGDELFYTQPWNCTREWINSELQSERKAYNIYTVSSLCPWKCRSQHWGLVGSTDFTEDVSMQTSWEQAASLATRENACSPDEVSAIYLSQVTIKYRGNCQGKIGRLHFFFQPILDFANKIQSKYGLVWLLGSLFIFLRNDLILFHEPKLHTGAINLRSSFQHIWPPAWLYVMPEFGITLLKKRSA